MPFGSLRIIRYALRRTTVTGNFGDNNNANRANADFVLVLSATVTPANYNDNPYNIHIYIDCLRLSSFVSLVILLVSIMSSDCSLFIKIAYRKEIKYILYILISLNNILYLLVSITLQFKMEKCI